MSREEIGTLIIVVLKARNLNDKHKFRKQDAFAKVSLNGTEKKTKVDIKGGQHPVWDDEIRFPVLKAATGKFRTAEISVWSKEPRDDDLLGKATLDISKIIETGEFDEWVPLAIDETVRGDVYLEITYYSHGPAPPQAQNPSPKPSTLAVPQGGLSNLQRRPSKLSPSDRLSRPGVNMPHQGPTQGYQNHGGHGTPPGSHYGRVSPKKDGPLPSLPESQPLPSKAPPPNLLRPGANPAPRPYYEGPTSPIRPTLHESTSLPPPQQNPYLTPSYNRPSTTPSTPQSNPYLASSTPAPITSNLYTQSPVQTPQIYPQVPSGVPASYTPAPQQQHPPQSYTPAPQQQAPVSYTPVPQQQQQPPVSYTPTPQPPGAYPPPQHQQQAPPPVSYTPAPYGPPPSTTPAPPSAPPPLWSDAPSDGPPVPGGGFFFPTPNVPSHQSASADPYPPAWGGNGRSSSPYDHYNGHGHHRRDSDPRADPALLSRYATPLPLPPGAEAERESRRRVAASPPPAAASSPPPPRPYKAHSPSPPRPPKQPSSGPPNDRLVMLMRAEEDAARRREQEKKDLELAMALDRELNL